MKKILFFAAFAALLSVASCQKEAVDKSVESPVFTATIAGESKTTIDISDGVGKIAWEDSDEITVKDAKSATAIYKVESIDQSTGRATFVIKDGEAALGVGPYSATYGAEPSTSQTYSETAGKLYMTAPATETNSFTFTVACGLMKLNLTKANQSVKKIQVIGTPTEGSKTIYTLTFTEAKSIDSASDFYIALPAGTYTRIELTNDSGLMCILKAKTALNIEINHIKPVTLPASTIDFNAISGVFSVSDTRKVYFSRGNLQATYNGSNYTWAFAANQYDYIGNAAGNTTITSLGKNNTNAVVDLFGWSTEKTNYGINTSTTPSAYNGGFKDWGKNIGDGNTWCTLTSAEWIYIFNSRAASTVSGVQNARYAKATVNGKNGVILLPDAYFHPAGVTPLASINTADVAFGTNTFDTAAWSKMEIAGAVFLPTAGYRNGSSVLNATSGYGYCWSSTTDNNIESKAYRLVFYGTQVNPASSTDRRTGCSVRLVTNAN